MKKSSRKKYPKGGTTPDYTGMGIGFMNNPAYKGDKISQQGFSQPISNKQRYDELVNSPEFQNRIMNASIGSASGKGLAVLNKYKPTPGNYIRSTGVEGFKDLLLFIKDYIPLIGG